MQQRHFEAIIFSTKAAIAAVFAAVSYEFSHLPGAPWVAAVSAVIVTQPSLHSSLKASLFRVAANLGGAFGGAALCLVLKQPLLAMAAGVMFTGLLCYLLKQDDALRPAFVAVVLVTLIGEPGNWHAPLDRVAGVCAGCACALFIGFLFDKISGGVKFDKNEKTGNQDLGE